MAKKRNPAEETDSDLLIDMQDIVKTFNIGTPNELTILHGVNFNLARGEFLFRGRYLGLRQINPHEYYWIIG